MKDNIHTTTCPMDCPDTCTLQVTVNDNKIISIAAGQDNPNTNGFICNKISRFARRYRATERIRTPMRKSASNGSFKPITWQEAVTEISERFKQIISEYGAEAILPYHYGGSNGFLTDEFTDQYFFSRLGASRLDKTLCAVPTGLAAQGIYGKMPGSSYEHFTHSHLIIIWGANPRASHIHLTPFITEARTNGAKIVLIDPVRTLPAEVAAIHLPVLPGTDLPLALALINYWHKNKLLDDKFIRHHCINAEPLLAQAAQWSPERAARVCGLKAPDIIRLAELYAQTSPAIIRCGWGLERNRNGAHAAAAILAIPALMGKFGVRGSGFALSNGGFMKLQRENIISFPQNNARLLNMTRLGKLLTDNDLDPPVKALFVYNANPVATTPDQNAIIRGLERDDLFTVVFDQVMTDTAQYADLILPATTFLEHFDLRRSYGTYHMGMVKPVIMPLGEARSNHQVFSLLGKAMGWTDDIFSWPDEEIVHKMMKNLKYFKGTGEQNLSPIQFRDVLPATTDGKANLAPDILLPEPYQFLASEDDQFPLMLISPATTKTINSTLGEFNLPGQWLTIHPDDADQRNINSESTVRVFNQIGEVICRVRIDKKIRSGVVMLPKGAWRKSSMNSSTATALCPADINRVGGAACFNDARVEVESIL